MADPVRLMFAADRGVYRHIPTLLNSVRRNTKAELEVGVLVDGISDIEKQRLCQLFADIKFQFFDVGGLLPPGLRTQVRLSPMTYARLLMPGLVEWQRYVYLDVDMIVRGDIAEVYASDLRGKLMGAVFHRGELNSGLLVVDAGQWRSGDYTERLFNYGLEHSPKNADQDAMAALLKDEFYPLDERWNVLVDPMWGGPFPAAKVQGSKLLHYITGFKPWNLGRLITPRPPLAEWDRYRLRGGLPIDLAHELKLLSWQIYMLAKVLAGRIFARA